MAQACIAVLVLAVLASMSLRANRKFGRNQRLPMQWSLSGSVNWTAPRFLALSFTPILAAVMLLAMIAASIFLTPRPGQEGLVLPVFAAMGLTFVAVHTLHLWLIGRTLQGSGDTKNF